MTLNSSRLHDVVSLGKTLNLKILPINRGVDSSHECDDLRLNNNIKDLQLTLMLFIPSKLTLFPQESTLFEASDNIQSSLRTNHEAVGYVQRCLEKS